MDPGLDPLVRDLNPDPRPKCYGPPTLLKQEVKTKPNACHHRKNFRIIVVRLFCRLCHSGASFFCMCLSGASFFCVCHSGATVVSSVCVTVKLVSSVCVIVELVHLFVSQWS